MFSFMLMLLSDEERDRIGRLWTEYGGVLIRWSFERLGAASAYKGAEDIVSEAFSRLIESYERYNGRTDEQMKSILLRTCRNLCIDEYRRSRLISFTSLEEDAPAFPEDETAAPEDLVISAETVGRLKRIVQSLDGKYRDVLEMKILEELPDAAVAEELGIPKATMQTRLMRARRLVIEKWKEENSK